MTDLIEMDDALTTLGYTRVGDEKWTYKSAYVSPRVGVRIRSTAARRYRVDTGVVNLGSYAHIADIVKEAKLAKIGADHVQTFVEDFATKLRMFAAKKKVPLDVVVDTSSARITGSVFGVKLFDLIPDAGDFDIDTITGNYDLILHVDGLESEFLDEPLTQGFHDEVEAISKTAARKRTWLNGSVLYTTGAPMQFFALFVKYGLAGADCTEIEIDLTCKEDDFNEFLQATQEPGKLTVYRFNFTNPPVLEPR